MSSNNFNDIVAEPLMVTNKNDWFEWVKNYLISQDLWKVTSRIARPEKYRVKDFAKWRRKNAAALHVIRISCGTNNLHYIRGAFEAKVAWDTLYDIYNPPPPSLPQGKCLIFFGHVTTNPLHYYVLPPSISK